MAGQALRVGVIGAGVIGLLSALELQRRGHQVTILDPGPAGGVASASYGNGAWINPGAVMPISTPGLWKRIPGYLLDPTGPFVIRWRHLPKLAPWLWRFVRAGSSWAKIEACAVQRHRLCTDTVAGHLRAAEEAGVGHLLRRTGLTFVYRTRAEREAEAREWALRHQLGVGFSELTAEDLRQLEPDLSPDYQFGMRIDAGAHIADTRAYLAALADLVVARGGQVLRAGARLRIAGGQLLGVALEGGGTLDFDRVVIAAGAWSGALARQAGDRVPLVSERGYHLFIRGVTDRPRTPLMPQDGKMAVTPMAEGLRIAGQVELASLSAAPDWRRVGILAGFARRMFPGIEIAEPAQWHPAQDGAAPARIETWMGHRPSTPDGLPVIGPASGCGAVIHAFGHGHTGICHGPATAQLVAALIEGSAPPFPVEPFSARRFA